jgi:hypothetical protein
VTTDVVGALAAVVVVADFTVVVVASSVAPSTVAELGAVDVVTSLTVVEVRFTAVSWASPRHALVANVNASSAQIAAPRRHVSGMSPF